MTPRSPIVRRLSAAWARCRWGVGFAVGVAGVCLGASLTAGAPAPIIAPGAIVAPGMPFQRTGVSWASLQESWGRPRWCWPDTPGACAKGTAFYRRGVEVDHDALVSLFWVYGSSWATPSGFHVGGTLEGLRAVYGPRLRRVRNHHQAVGHGTVMPFEYIVRVGNAALGFGMAGSRVETILTGSFRDVRDALSRYGPI